MTRIAAVALALTLSLAPGAARGQDRASCEVLMIHALRDGGGIDRQLSQLPQLREPPFNAFTTFRLLRRSRLQLVPGASTTLALPTGRTLRFSLIGRMAESRLKFQVSINRPNRSDYLPAVEYVTQRGEPFFQAGQTYERGVLVLGFVCR